MSETNADHAYLSQVYSAADSHEKFQRLILSTGKADRLTEAELQHLLAVSKRDY